MKSEKKTIEKKRTIYLTSIIVLSILGTAVVYFTTAKRIRERIVNEYIQTKTLALTSEFTNRAERLENSIRLFSQWGQNGLINLKDTASFERAFIPVLIDAKSIYAISIIENNGNEYEIFKKDSVYQSTFYFPEDEKILKKTINNRGKVIEAQTIHQAKKDFKRNWLMERFVDSNYIWQGPSLYKGNKEIVSLVSSWTNKDSSIVRIAIHVLLKDFFKVFSEIEVNENEYLFLMNYDGEVYNLLEYENFAEKYPGVQLSMHPFYKIKIQEIKKAVETWISKQKDTANTLEFRIKNHTYWTKFVSINKKGSKYLLGIVVSEKSINSKLGEKNLLVIVLSVLIIIFGAFIGFVVVIRMNRHLRELQPKIRANYIEKDIQHLAGLPESKSLEFKSTIRHNLHTGKNDRAIEFAWMKGVAAFLNTDGGIILIGIRDDGSFHGIEKDGFENEDKALLHIKNLITKNIGIEYMKFVNMFTARIEGKTIIALQCKQSSKPAYIKNGGEEQFYVRAGSSSTKLTVQQAVEHIFTHGYKRIVTVS